MINSKNTQISFLNVTLWIKELTTLSFVSIFYLKPMKNFGNFKAPSMYAIYQNIYYKLYKLYMYSTIYQFTRENKSVKLHLFNKIYINHYVN